MKLSGFSSVYSGFGEQTFPLPVENRGGGFLDEVLRTTMAASFEKLKKYKEQEGEDAQLRALYDQLSPTSKSVLERLANGTNGVRKDEWLGLCRELKDAGVISQSDFDYTRGDLRLIPIGYRDENGNFVRYDTPPMLKAQLRSLYEQSQNPTGVWLDSGDWTGDPLEYLNLRISEWTAWKDDLSARRTADGALRYHDFSPITDQIDSCRKVAGLVQRLAGLS